MVVPDFQQAEYVTLLTRQGRIKRMKLEEFEAVRPSGIIAMNLDPGDELGWARATFGNQEFIIVAEGGRALRFAESEVRAMGRTAAGVIGIRMVEGEQVASFDVVEPNGEMVVLTQNGWGKRAPLEEFPAHSRGGQGVWSLDHTRVDQTGKVAAARIVQAEGSDHHHHRQRRRAAHLGREHQQDGPRDAGVRIVNPDERRHASPPWLGSLAAVTAQAEQDEARQVAPRRKANAERRVPNAGDRRRSCMEGPDGNGEGGNRELAVDADGADNSRDEERRGAETLCLGQ